jgi:hypothetical protein
MTDTTTSPTPDTQVEQPQAARASADTAEVADTPAAPESLGESGEKALKAERAARRAAEKATNEALAKVKAFEDAQKSETERLADQLQQLQTEAATAKAEALRLRVAAELGLSADLHEFLVGDDEEQVRAQAQKLMAATAAATDPRRPAPDPTQGAKQGAGKDQLTRADLAGKSPEWIEEQRRAGRLDHIQNITTR